MKIIKKLVLSICLLFAFLALSAPALTSAADACGDNCSTGGGPSGSTGGAPSSTELSASLKTNPIVKNIINPLVKFLGAGVGVVVVGTIILGGIQYSIAGGSADAVSKAKQRVINGLIALVAYLLIFGFLQWIIPGGIFNS